MKLSVDQPPPLKRNGDSRGNRFRNQTSNAHARLEFLLKCARKPRVEMRPVRAYSHLRVVEVRTGQRIEHERRPKADQNRCERHDLHAQRRERQQEEERVAQTNLRERVFERPVGVRPFERAQEDPEEDEDEAAPDGMSEHAAEALALALPARDREWQRRAGQERKRWLNQVVERTALPGHVRGVVGDEGPESAGRECLR